ncbi:MAG: amidohydrolase [Saprospirales bacterium]|nr:amidohydrolase [Saprospirales bacterium]
MKFAPLALCLLPFLVFSQKEIPADLKSGIDSDFPYLHDLYLHCHANPELSFHEYNTSARMAGELRKAGFEVTEKVGGNGVVGVLKNGEGPTILVRADMDALPIAEETGLPYSSAVKATDESGNTVGVMHACGHDVHMTVWTGAARAMASQRATWKGTLVFIAQPAEESSGGAKAMLKEGLYERFPRPDYALALHVNANLPAGQVGICPGYSMANVDMVNITVYGKGGHGAMPHQTIDPVVLSARIILALQTIVSRELPPSEPAVLTVGAIHGGAKGNVIPEEVKMELTLRSYSDEVREAMIEKITRICNGEAMSAGLPENMYPKIVVRDEYTPALYNDPALAGRVEKAFEKAIGDENVLEVPAAMVGEDFGRYGRTEPKVPILLFWLGSVDPVKLAAARDSGAGLPSLHSSKYAPLPEPTIKTGVLTMCSALFELLN